MKKKIIIYILSAFVIFYSCKKDNLLEDPIASPSPDEMPGGGFRDTANVLLKEIITPSLPSPFYRFVYNRNKYVTEIGFASDLFLYSLHYEANRLKQMINQRTHTTIQYSYTGDLVTMMRQFSGLDGKITWEYHFTYDDNRQLVEINWLLFSEKETIHYRKLLLNYYADGNLAGTEDFFANKDGVLEWRNSHEYKNYDHSVCVDGFSLFKNFFETLLYLPAVKFQINNPGIEIIKGIDQDFTLTYHNQYNSQGWPLLKAGTMVTTRGVDEGKVFNFSTRFSYY